MVLVIYAHPYPDRSRANRRLLGAVRDLPGVEVRSLYDLYPDFDIDIDSEQQALLRAGTVVWHHPMYWYSVPGLLKHWFDKVLLRGWAYGEGGTALRGKRCQWVTTTGGNAQAFQPDGMHQHVFEAFVPVIQQTAQFCGMLWQPPLVVHGAHHIPDDELGQRASDYQSRLTELLATEPPRQVSTSPLAASLDVATASLLPTTGSGHV